MKRILKSVLDSLSWFILGLLYLFVISGIMSNILYGDGGFSYYTVIIISAVFYLFANIVFMNKKIAKVFGVLTIISIIIATIYCFANASIINSLLKHAEKMYIVWDKIINNFELDANADLYLKASLFITAFIGSILVILLFKKTKGALIINGIVLLLFIFSNSITENENKGLFIVFCVLIIISSINKASSVKAKEGMLPENISMGSVLLCTIPIILIPVFLIARIPKKETSIKNSLAPRIESLVLALENQFNHTKFESFSLSTIGFTNKDTNRLGGDVTANNIEVLRANTRVRTYLRGATYETYKNSTWEKDESKIYLANQQDVYELKNAWGCIPVDDMFKNKSEGELEFLNMLKDGELESLLFPSYSMEITMRNMKTNILFTPLKCILPIRYSYNEIMNTYQFSDGVLLIDYILKKGDKYKYTFIQPMYGDDYFKKALRYSRHYLYNDAINTLFSNLENLISDEWYAPMKYDSSCHDRPEEFLEIVEKIDDTYSHIRTLEQLIGIANDSYRRYTAYDKDIPKRVGELAREITSGINTDFDRVVAIEEYLRDNYTYTYTPGEVPIDRDLVDYFLFDCKEGYCTYYATSMVILLRSIGIPARYVEGYVLPAEQRYEHTYSITNQNAHAWVEVYFEGFGWMVFEPTSAYAGTMNYKSAFYNMLYEDNLSYQEMMERYKSSNFSQNTHTPVYSNPLPEKKKESASIAIIIISFLLACVALLVLFIIIDLLILLIMTLRFKSMKKEKAVMLKYYHMLKWLSLKGYRIEAGETALEFADKMDEIFYLPHSFRETTEVFSKVRYGHLDITHDEYNIINLNYSELKKQILKEIGFKRYMPLRKIILRI